MTNMTNMINFEEKKSGSRKYHIDYYNRHKRTSKKIIDLVNSGLRFDTKSELEKFLVNMIHNEDLINKFVEETHPRYTLFKDLLLRHDKIEFEPKMIFMIHVKIPGEEEKKFSDAMKLWRDGNKGIIADDDKVLKLRAFVFIPSQDIWKTFSLFKKCVLNNNTNNPTQKITNYRQKVAEFISDNTKSIRKWKCSEPNCDYTNYRLRVIEEPTLSNLVKLYEQEPQKETWEEFFQKNVKFSVKCYYCRTSNKEKND